MTLDELDRLAAIHVMGWSVSNNSPQYIDAQGLLADYYISEWQPTRNIEQAWECLEKLTDDRWLFTIYAGAQDKSCVVYKYSESFHEYGKSAAEAIVRACLKAKGVDI